MAPLKNKQKNPGDELHIHDPQSIFWLVWAWTLHLRTLTSSLFVSACRDLRRISKRKRTGGNVKIRLTTALARGLHQEKTD